MSFRNLITFYIAAEQKWALMKENQEVYKPYSAVGQFKFTTSLKQD